MRDVKPAFSRKALNILIFITAGLILVFSQMGPNDYDQLELTEAADQTKVPTTQAQGVKSTVADYFLELSDVPEIPDVSLDLEIQKWITPQGLKVYFVENHDLPMVDMRLVFDGGSARDPANKAGLAALTASLVNIGAVGLGPTEVAESFERLGAEMSAGSLRDMAIGTLRVLQEPQYLEPSVDLFSRVMSEIEFSQEDLNRELSRQKIAVAHKAQSPQAQIGDAIFEQLYGVEHPYGRASTGTAHSLENLASADVIAFHSEYYAAKNAVLAVVGAISRTQLEDMAQVLAARLSQSEAPQSLKLGTQVVADVRHHINFPSDQTHIALVGPGVHRGHEDYYGLFLTNHILGGGGFSSLLNKEIRQNQAFAYSIGSSLSPMAGTGPVTIQMQTRGDQAAAAITAVQQVVDGLATNGPSEAVLADAKQQILSEFAMRAASNSSQLGYLGNIGFYNLPMDYLATFNEKIEAISVSDVKLMTTRYFQKLAVITVGKDDPL